MGFVGATGDWSQVLGQLPQAGERGTLQGHGTQLCKWRGVVRKELGIGDGRRDHRAWPGAGHMEGKRQGKQGVIWTPSLGSSVKALLW